MGVGYLVSCRKCGMSKELMLGMGAIDPNHFRPDILDGKFGEDAKAYLEQNPDAFFLVNHVPYGCSCGYVTEFGEVEFPDRDILIRKKPRKCSNCGKRMKRNNWGSGKCWMCGGDLATMENMMWD
ncbi:MAG: hypothetical protein II933_06305 [Candidatus Methanomethylophilaceae archaeon]|nr:hypothetical protein [Candidatus Methanomethylophilaceae archaeon]